MFIENPTDAKNLLSLLNEHSSIINVYYTKSNTHVCKNSPLVLMVNVDRKYYIVSFEHPDSTNIPVDFLNLIFKSTGTKLIFDRKKLKYHVKKWHEIFAERLGIEWLEQKSFNTPIQKWNAERKGIVTRTHSGAMLEHIEEVQEAVDGIKQKRGIPCPSIGKYNVIILNL